VHLRRRRRIVKAEQLIAESDESYREARAAHQEQVAKRDQERNTVIARTERLAKENHLGGLVWYIASGQNHH